ncbi:MAG: PD40 domain-containing protein, partial [Candidatus Heimdallarchaeota archaeon]|nr:PD40 domain-containing protein [Candidatus Heimdallarchaeota archaeon]
KYIAYGTNETGRFELFIKTFPDMKGKWQVSDEGGLAPVWSPDGNSLYYVNNVGKMMIVPIKKKPFFSPGKPKILFDVSQMYFPNNPLANFDLSPDGKRFIMVRNSGYKTSILGFNMVINWISELEKKLNDDQ